MTRVVLHKGEGEAAFRQTVAAESADATASSPWRFVKTESAHMLMYDQHFLQIHN